MKKDILELLTHDELLTLSREEQRMRKAAESDLSLANLQLRTQQEALDKALGEGGRLRVDPDMRLRLLQIREAGWAVAVHNDYRLDGESRTFWLFTRGSQCAKGEGLTDRAALIRVQGAINELDATLAGTSPDEKEEGN